MPTDVARPVAMRWVRVNAFGAGRVVGRMGVTLWVALDPGSALRAVRDDIFMAVIPAQAGIASPTAKLVIQRSLRGACLDPGSALRAVRDDDKEKTRAVRDDEKKKGWAVRDDVGEEARAGRDDTSHAASRMMASGWGVRRMGGLGFTAQASLRATGPAVGRGCASAGSRRPEFRWPREWPAAPRAWKQPRGRNRE